MENQRVQCYKYCAVPCCTNTTAKTPEKLFIWVPKDKIRRLKWLKAARRDNMNVSLKTTLYFCEDHFVLEECVENLYYVRLMHGRMALKKTALPTKFECQGRRIYRLSGPTRPSLVTRQGEDRYQSCDLSLTMIERREINHLRRDFFDCDAGKFSDVVQLDYEPNVRQETNDVEKNERLLKDLNQENEDEVTLNNVEMERANLPLRGTLFVNIPSALVHSSNSSSYLAENVKIETEVKQEVDPKVEETDEVERILDSSQVPSYLTCNIKLEPEANEEGELAIHEHDLESSFIQAAQGTVVPNNPGNPFKSSPTLVSKNIKLEPEEDELIFSEFDVINPNLTEEVKHGAHNKEDGRVFNELVLNTSDITQWGTQDSVIASESEPSTNPANPVNVELEVKHEIGSQDDESLLDEIVPSASNLALNVLAQIAILKEHDYALTDFSCSVCGYCVF